MKKHKKIGSAPASKSRVSSGSEWTVMGQRFTTARLWRVGGAAAAALLAYLIVCNGFIVGAPEYQTGVFPGLVAGVLAGSLVDAGIAVVLGVGCGLVLFTPWYVGADVGLGKVLGLDLALVGVALLVALAAAWVAKNARGEQIVTGVAIVYLIANLMWSTYLVNSIEFPDTGSLNQRLNAPLAENDVVTDAQLFTYVFQHVTHGDSYYAAYHEAYRSAAYANRDPNVIFQYRLPTATRIWSLFTTQASQLPWLFMTVAVLGIASSFGLSAMFVRPGYALIGAASIAVYAFFAATADVVTYTEFWAFPNALASIALFIYWTRKGDSARWALWTSAAFAAVACLVRELVVFLPIAGLIASLVGVEGNRKREALLAWGAALATFCVGFGIHSVAASHYLVSSANSLSQWGQGGFRHLWLSINFAMEFVGLSAVIPALLVILGILGALMVKDRTAKVILLFSIGAPLVGFLFVGGGFGHQDAYWGGYWGAVVVPIALSSAPLALGLLPPRMEASLSDRRRKR